MRNALEKAVGDRLAEKEEPSPDYVSTKLDEIEANDPTASVLDEVQSKAEVQTMQLQTLLDSHGNINIQSKNQRGGFQTTVKSFAASSRSKPIHG